VHLDDGVDFGRSTDLTVWLFLLKFEHAAHVTMSVQKLLTRIVKPSDLLSQTGKQAKTAVELHDHTFGITSDPLCQFAVVLSALIHDAGHPGVANSVLVEEEDPMAIKYNCQSVAEQNSGKRESNGVVVTLRVVGFRSSNPLSLGSICTQTCLSTKWTWRWGC
jgi:3'5'-cyclic nucleotide phosphodiesterase